MTRHPGKKWVPLGRETSVADGAGVLPVRQGREGEAAATGRRVQRVERGGGLHFLQRRPIVPLPGQADSPNHPHRGGRRGERLGGIEIGQGIRQVDPCLHPGRPPGAPRQRQLGIELDRPIPPAERLGQGRVGIPLGGEPEVDVVTQIVGEIGPPRQRRSSPGPGPVRRSGWPRRAGLPIRCSPGRGRGGVPPRPRRWWTRHWSCRGPAPRPDWSAPRPPAGRCPDES